MDRGKVNELKELLYEDVDASSKAEAKPVLRHLQFKASMLNVDAYTKEKLNKAIDYASKASGQVRNKDHWIQAMERSWYVFESNIHEKRAD